MAYNTPKVQKIMLQPINVIFRFLQSRERVSIWITEVVTKRIEGVIVGFDEFMNLVIEDTYEIKINRNSRRKIGKILLRGNTITLIQPVNTDETCQASSSSSEGTTVKLIHDEIQSSST